MTFLAQEPWCMTPAEIAKLTDWQIEHLYARPALAAQDRTTAAGTPARVPSSSPHGPSGCTVTEGPGWRKFSFSSDGEYPDGLGFGDPEAQVPTREQLEAAATVMFGGFKRKE